VRKSTLTLLGLVFALASMVAHAGPAIQPFARDTLTQIIEKHKGKPFVIVLWSLDCVYCQVSLKTLAEETPKRKDLTIVTIATDSADDPEAASLMQERLASLGMQANAWAYGSAPPEQLRYAIDPKWRGEKPRTYWFNAAGEKVAYSGTVSTETIAKLWAR
jgi:hypothetical protein